MAKSQSNLSSSFSWTSNQIFLKMTSGFYVFKPLVLTLLRKLLKEIDNEGKGRIGFEEFMQGMHWLNKALQVKSSMKSTQIKEHPSDLQKALEMKDREIYQYKQRIHQLESEVLELKKENRSLRDSLKTVQKN